MSDTSLILPAMAAGCGVFLASSGLLRERQEARGSRPVPARGYRAIFVLRAYKPSPMRLPNPGDLPTVRPRRHGRLRSRVWGAAMTRWVAGVPGRWWCPSLRRWVRAEDHPSRGVRSYRACRNRRQALRSAYSAIREGAPGARLVCRRLGHPRSSRVVVREYEVTR